MAFPKAADNAGQAFVHERTARNNAIANRLLDHARNQTTDHARQIMELPVDVYSDPKQFALEMEKIFRRVPLVFGFTAELRSPGDFKTLRVAGVPVLLVRSQDGVARAFVNACRHRGILLAEASGGKAVRFTCPYHGWTYATDGRLIGVPCKNTVGEIDPIERGLVALPCEERHGLIFGSVTPGGGLDLDGFYGDVLRELEHYRFEEWHRTYNDELTGANWKATFDGYLENYHIPIAHRETLSPYICGNLAVYEAFGPHLRFSIGARSIMELEAIPADERGSREGQEWMMVFLLFPNISLSLNYNGVAGFAQIFPDDDVYGHVTKMCYLSREAPKDEAALEAARESSRGQIEVLANEDYAMSGLIQRGTSTRAPITMMFGRNEPGNQYFHRWVQYYLNDLQGSPPELF